MRDKNIDEPVDDLYAIDTETVGCGWRIMKCGKVIAKEESSADEDDDFLFSERDFGNCGKVDLEELTECYRALGADSENFGNNQSAVAGNERDLDFWRKIFEEAQYDRDVDIFASNVCRKCGEKYEYAEPEIGFECWGCRHGY